MLTWLICSYLLVLLALIGCAGCVALFVDDDRRRRQAFRVLQLLLGASTGVVALTAFHVVQNGLFG
ncbi:MAG TPA: hypothetical protein VNV66_01910 [Pilimelia sp.]|nr:hypothetical protein [Pilimelia sp.]